MKNYIVSYKSRGGNVALSFYKVKAKTQDQAIKMAKRMFVKDWFEGESAGRKRLNRLSFYIS